MKRIGITINLDVDLFSNGINQNAIYLAKLLKSIGYNTYLIGGINKKHNPIGDIKVISFDDAWKIPFHLIIKLGASCETVLFNRFKEKNKNVKLVFYDCGNKYIMDMEAILFKPSENNINTNTARPHQIWSIPQMEKTNLDYYKFLYNQEKATVVPFVWDPMYIESISKEKGYTTYSNRSLNRVGVLEPNRSVMKNILLPLIILDKYYKKFKDLNQVILYTSDQIKYSETFKSAINLTSLLEDKKIFANKREYILDIINKSIDVVLSWQWENNLNYLWLDVAWMGFPVIHNGSLCQDIGYYYDEFNVPMAVEQLKNTIDNHNQDAEYLSRNREAIKRYTSNNEELKNQYKILIENVLDNKFEQYSYDWKTNSIL